MWRSVCGGVVLGICCRCSVETWTVCVWWCAEAQCSEMFSFFLLVSLLICRIQKVGHWEEGGEEHVDGTWGRDGIGERRGRVHDEKCACSSKNCCFFFFGRVKAKEVGLREGGREVEVFCLIPFRFFLFSQISTNRCLSST